MKKLILMMVFVLNIFPVYSQLYKFPKDTNNFNYRFEFNVKYEKRATSSYYDTSGKVVTNIADTNYVFDEQVKLLIPEDFEREFGFNFNQHIIELEANYKINERANLFIKAPISFYYLDEYYVSQDWYLDSSIVAFNKSNKAELSLQQIDYFEFGGFYEFLDGNFNLGLLSSIRIPTGFDNSMVNDGYALFSDGAIQVMAGAELGIKGETTQFTVKPIYKYRAEEFSDMFLLNSNLTISSIKNTSLSIFLDYAESLNKEEISNFNLREFPFQESYLDAGFGFWIVFNYRYSADFMYKIRVSGTDTWQMNMFNVKLGYRL